MTFLLRNDLYFLLCDAHLLSLTKCETNLIQTIFTYSCTILMRNIKLLIIICHPHRTYCDLMNKVHYFKSDR